MNFFQHSHYQINKRLLYYLGQWPLQTPKERLFFRSLTAILIGSIVLPKVIKMVEYWGNFNNMINCCAVLGLHVVSIIKFIISTLNARKAKELAIRIEKNWETQGSDIKESIMREYAVRGRYITVIYAIMLFSALGLYLGLPLVPFLMDAIKPLNQSRQLIYLYETEYFVDQDEYYFIILIHYYMTMPFSVGMIVGYDTMFGVYVQHACGIFSILSSQLERIGVSHHDNREIQRNSDKRRDDAYEKIVACIKIHQSVLEFIRLLESMTCVCFFFSIGLCMIMITMTGFMVVTHLDEPDIAFRFGAFALGEVVHMFFLCWQGQLLIDHSEQIFFKVYNVSWYNISLRAKKLLILIMMQSSVPCTMTAGKMFVMSLQNFALALKTSMSYFTVLLSMQ
uniref:Odorant receptor n=1 Tax=Campoletis chlorideae TaxID=219166 RepID=A0A346D413_9HYME|nr:odorant receptor [Campoletis chlorideae]